MGRRLIVESVRVRDFLSYAGEQEITFGGRGPVAIVGHNGAGKSTIGSKALTWCLFGETAPERMGGGTHKLRGASVIREGAKDCEVTVTLRDGEKLYTIRRYRKSNRSDDLVVSLDGVELQDGGQPTVDRLLGVGAETFVRTVVRGQNDPWSFAEATDAKKREILDVVSGAEALGPAYEKAKSRRQELQSEAQALRQELDVLNRQIQDSRVAGLQQEVDTWAQGHKAKVEEAQQQVLQATVQLKEAEAADAHAADIMAQRRAVEERRPSIDWSLYDTAIQEATTAHAHAMAQFNALDQELRRIQEIAEQGACPSCGQAIHGDAPVRTRLGEVTVQHEQARVSGINLHQHLTACQQAKAEANTWLQEQTQAWQAELNALPAPANQATAPNARKFLTQAQTHLEAVQAAENPWIAALQQEKDRELKVRREITLKEEAYRTANDNRRLAESWEATLAPKGVRAHMAEAALVAIEIEANKWLHVLSEGLMSIEFSSTTETKAGEVRERIDTVIRYKGQERPLLAFSGGEKRRINLAVDLGVAATFGRGQLALSFLVLDEECFSGLDLAGKQGVVQALHHAGVDDIVVIDHDPTLAGALDRTFEVSRGLDGWSRIEERA